MDASPSPIRRIGVYRFFALISVPTALVLGALCLHIFLSLNDIQSVATSLRHERLPGLLESQRTLTNLETLRRNAETVCVSEDAGQRRIARLSAQTLLAEFAFETSPSFPAFASAAQDLIRRLDDAKFRSEEAANELHRGELLLSGVLARLYQTFGWPNNVRFSHDARHMTDVSTEKNEARYESARTQFEPLINECRREDLPTPVKQDCARFQAEWSRVGTAWKERVRRIDEARDVWRRLDSLLEAMTAAATTAEATQANDAVGRIQQEISNTRLTFYFSSFFLLCVLLGFAAALHHSIVSPIALAARTLRNIRFGLSAQPLPPVRLRELQELLDLLPSLGQVLAELNARSGELEEEKNRYAHLSLLDGLTGVGNRRSFDLRLAEKRSVRKLALLMLDVDLFKRYNDSLGHRAGDICLIKVAQAIRAALLRSDDEVFRYGGEEFTVILPDATPDEARSVAERILDSVRGLRLPHPSSDVAPFVTVSIGVALRAEGEAVDDAVLVERADHALYATKNTGRNGVSVSGERAENDCRAAERSRAD